MKIHSLLITFLLIASGVALAQEPNLTLSSSAFTDQGNIPSKYTCDGANFNPPLAVHNVPVHTESLVLIVHDLDAPAGDWIHWVVYDIDPRVTRIDENTLLGKELINNFNQFHYGGPCPPAGESHHYIFDLYALDTTFQFNANGSPQGLLQMMQGHVLSRTSLIGVYKRK